MLFYDLIKSKQLCQRFDLVAEKLHIGVQTDRENCKFKEMSFRASHVDLCIVRGGIS